jgi:hypothetical protein
MKLIITGDEREKMRTALQEAKAYRELRNECLLLLSYADQLNTQALCCKVRDILIAAEALPDNLANELTND